MRQRTACDLSISESNEWRASEVATSNSQSQRATNGVQGRQRQATSERPSRNLRVLKSIEITQKSLLTGVNGWLMGFAGSPKLTRYLTGD
ncbi:hypothetical protein TB1_025127 [Malus domestica]